MIRYTNKFPRLSLFRIFLSRHQLQEVVISFAAHQSILHPPSAVQGSPSSSSRAGRQAKQDDRVHICKHSYISQHVLKSPASINIGRVIYITQVILLFLHLLIKYHQGLQEREREKEMLWPPLELMDEKLHFTIHPWSVSTSAHSSVHYKFYYKHKDYDTAS